MDRREQHHQHKEKAREQKKKEEKAFEEDHEKRRLPIHPAWLVVLGVLMTMMAVYVWTFGLTSPW
jgi:uncharacterized membrane protein